ncbi:MAG TPA: preprotein translocase subunit SecG [Vicinamibacteria bacterium]|nr:preprotein translocase subunit SecG [Vicinamibacteria bacterium]
MAFVYYAIVLLHILACLFLIGVVLLQQGKSQDLASAFGGGGTQTAFGPRGSANVLSRATTILAGLFMVTSLSLSMVRPRSGTILDTVKTPAASPAPARSGGPAPATTPPAQSAAPTPAAPGPAAKPTPASPSSR